MVEGGGCREEGVFTRGKCHLRCWWLVALAAWVSTVDGAVERGRFRHVSCVKECDGSDNHWCANNAVTLP